MKPLTTSILLILLVVQVHADRPITGIGQYRMSDLDSDEQARQIALERALQQAREKAGLFQVSAISRRTLSSWDDELRHDYFAQRADVRSSVTLKILDKDFVPIEERVRSSVRLKGRTYFIEDRVRYWTCAVEVEVIETEMELAAGEPSKGDRPVAAESAARVSGPKSAEQDSSVQPYISAEYQLFSEGMEHLLRRRWDAARDLFSHLLKEDPADGDALYLLAFCLEKMGDHAAFRQVLSAAIKRYPHKSIYGVLQARLEGEYVRGLML